MRRIIQRATLTAAAGLLTTAASAATFTVDAATGSDNGSSPFATIQAAIDAAASAGGADEVVVNPGTYVEALTIAGHDVTVRGSDPADRPIVVLQAGTSVGGIGGNGVAITGSGITVEISDFIFLPGTLTGKGIITNEEVTDGTQTVTYTNLLFATNNGSNQPDFTDPFDNVTPITNGWPSDCFYAVNRAFVSLADGNGVHTWDDVICIGSGRDAWVVYPRGEGSTPSTPASATFSDCIAARSVRRGMQAGAGNQLATPYTFLVGDKGYSFIAVNNADDGIWINSAGVLTIDGYIGINNDIGALIAGDNATSIDITNSLITGSTNDGILFYSDGTTTGVPIAISNNTFHDNGDAAGATATGAVSVADTIPTAVLTMTDNVITGVLDAGIVAQTGTGANITLNNNCLDVNLAAAIAGDDAGSVTNNNPVVVDPAYVSTDVSTLAATLDAFDVQNLALQGAASDSSDLTGYGELVIVAGAENWSLYR